MNQAMTDAWQNAPNLQSSSGVYEELVRYLLSGGSGFGQLLGKPFMVAGSPLSPYLNQKQRVADIDQAVGQDQQVAPQPVPQQAQPIRNQKAPITKQLGDGSWVQWDDYNQAWVPVRGI